MLSTESFVGHFKEKEARERQMRALKDLLREAFLAYKEKWKEWPTIETLSHVETFIKSPARQALWLEIDTNLELVKDQRMKVGLEVFLQLKAEEAEEQKGRLAA